MLVSETKLPRRAYSTCSCVTVEVSTGFRHLLVLPVDASGLQLLQRIEAETGVPSSQCSQATLSDGHTRTKVGLQLFGFLTSWSKAAVRCTKFDNRVCNTCGFVYNWYVSNEYINSISINVGPALRIYAHYQSNQHISPAKKNVSLKWQLYPSNSKCSVCVQYIGS